MVSNVLLSILPEGERRRMEPYSEHVRLEARQTLCRPNEPISYVWFPERGVCSTLLQLSTGDAVEVGLIGYDGMIGLPLVLGELVNPFHVCVQMPGSATRIPAGAFLQHVIEPGSPFCRAMLRYAGLYMTTLAQTAACNRLHRIEQRLSRWLLAVRQRMDDDVLPITHEFLALTVGAYRPSVTNALTALEERGAIRAGRGHVTIVDRAALAAEACECFVTINERQRQTVEQIRSLAA